MATLRLRTDLPIELAQSLQELRLKIRIPQAEVDPKTWTA